MQRMIQLEKKNVADSQHQKRATIEKNPVPESLWKEILEDNVCKALYLTGVNISP